MKFVECEMCKTGFGMLHSLAESRAVVETIKSTMKFVMQVYFTHQEASNIIDSYGDPIAAGLAAKLFNPHVMCEARYKVCPQKHFRELPTQDFVDSVLSDKPEFI